MKHGVRGGVNAALPEKHGRAVVHVVMDSHPYMTNPAGMPRMM